MQLSKTTIFKFLILTMGLLISTQSFAVTRTATTNNGVWTNPAHWTPNGVPTAADDVIIPSNISDFNADGITMNFSTLTIDGRLTVGTFQDGANVQTSTFAGTSVTVNGQLWLAETVNLEADITFTGSAIWDIRSYNITGINGTPTITLDAGALGRMTNINNTSNSNVTFSNVDFVNFGTFRKSGGFGEKHIFAGNFTNEATGLVEVDGPGLGGFPDNEIDFSGTLLNKSGGQVLNVHSTRSNLNLLGTITNDGTISRPTAITGILNGDGTYDFAGIGAAGTLGPDACLTFTNNLNISGTLAVDINGPVACTDYDQQTASNTVNILNGSTLDLDFGSFSSPGGGVVYTIIDGVTLTGSFTNVNGLPAGMAVQYDVPNGDVLIVDNNPPVPRTFISVQSGSWDTPSTWDINDVPSGNDIVTISAGHNVSSLGLTLNFGTLTVNATGTLGLGNFQNGAAVQTTTINGTSITVDGSVFVSENVDLAADMTFNNGSYMDLRSYNITGINGTPTITLNSGALARMQNLSNTSNTSVTYSNVDFVNFGRFGKFGGFNGDHIFAGSFTNESGGVVDVTDSNKGVRFSGTVNNKSGGTMEGLNFGRLFFSGSLTNDGTINNAQPIEGTVNGDGTFNGSVTIANTGTLGPDACLDFSSSLNLGQGTMAADISGTVACTDYDQQIVSGSVILGASSTLNLNFGSYTPTSSDLFTIIDASSVSNTFGSVNGLPAGFEVKYDFPNPGEVSVGDINFAPFQPLEFVVATPTAGPNNTVVVEISVNNFTDIGAYQGTINFDPSVLTYVSENSPQTDVQNIVGAPGAGGGSIPNNSLTFAWFDLSPTSLGQSLADGTVVLELTFTVNGSAQTGLTPITIDGSTTSLGFTPASGSSLSAPTVTDGGVNVDADPIVVDPVSIVSNNANTAYAKVGDDIILTFTTSEAPAVGPNVTIDKGGAGAVTVTDLGGGTSWEARKTVAAGDDGLVTFTIDVEDQYGNATTTTATTDGTSVIVDTEAPVISCPVIPATDAPALLCEATVNFANVTYTDANPDGAAVQIVGNPSGSAFPVGSTTLTFQATDLAGNQSSCDVDVVVNDVTAPVVITQAFTLTLDANGNGTVLPDDVDNGSNDPCGIASRTVSPNTFDCADEGTTVTVTLEVTDVNGLVASNTAQVTIQSVANSSIAGSAFSRANTLIPSVTFTANGTDGTQTQVGSTFSFDFDPCNGVNDIVALRNNDASLNGVNILDAFDVARHVLFINRITGEYNLLASDVNNSDNVNIFDAFQIARRVAGARTSFDDPNTGAAGAIWAFVPSDFTFPTPTAPFSYTAERSYTSQTPLTGQDFIGVKLGDVNNDWEANPSRRAAPSDSIHFVMEEVAAQAGDLITVPVSVQNFQDMSTFQYSMNWDPSVLELKGVNDKAIEAIYNIEDALDGHFTSAWFDVNGQSVSFDDGTVVFELVFEVVGMRGSTTQFEISSAPTDAMAHNIDRERMGIGTKGGVEVGALSTNVGGPVLDGYSLSQNTPNPFAGLTTINFSLGQSEDVQIDIYNTTGQVIRSFNNRYIAGSHEIKWDGSDRTGRKVSQGVYLVRLSAGEFSSTIRMKKMD